jgi:hypothetical protein
MVTQLAKTMEGTSEERLEATRILDRVAAELSDHGFSDVDIAHALISHGLHVFAAELCTEHLIEELEFVRDWIDERIADTKKREAQ